MLSSAVRYDGSDPTGEEWGDPASQLEARWDAFLGLKVPLARFRHAVAKARRASRGLGTDDGDEPDGGLRPIGAILEDVFAAQSRRA